MWLKKNGYLINMDHIIAIETHIDPFKMGLVNAKPIGPRLHRIEFVYENGVALQEEIERIMASFEDEEVFLNLDEKG